MRDFDKDWDRMERQGRWMSRFVTCWIALVFMLVIAGFIGGIVLLFHPAWLGAFAGQIVNGFNSTR